MELKNQRVLVTGGAGFVGQHVCKKLRERGVKDIFVPRSKFTDLRTMEACLHVVKNQDIIIHLAATVGGIEYNQKNPGKMIYDNLAMGVNMIEAARLEGVQKFVMLGTVCSYPRIPPHMPMVEEDLHHGYPEETNAPYGFAKRTLIEMTKAYSKQYGFPAINLIPTNLYGPGDTFDPERSHVIPALIKKFMDAKDQGLPYITLFGDGSPSREFLHVADCAEGIMLAIEKYDKPDHVNLGINSETTILHLANLLKRLTMYKGELLWDSSKPNGQPRRCLNAEKAEKEFGFKAKKFNLEHGLYETIDWYLSNEKKNN